MSPNNKMFIIDFKIEDNKFIQVIDSQDDFDKFNKIKEHLPDLDIVAIGSSKYAENQQNLNHYSCLILKIAV
jgi:DNA anti-recombination protein RmuC